MPKARSILFGKGRSDHKDELTHVQRTLEFSGDCNNKECPFLHVKPAFKTRDCPWYDQGFCKDGEALTERGHWGMWVIRVGCSRQARDADSW